VIEDPDNYGYYRPEGDGMLVGLFEPVAAPWSLDGVPRDFSFGKLPPDWERMEQFLGPALARIPCLSETGVRTFFCGPESFTADVKPLIGPAPELDGYFVAAGLNSLGILSGGGVGSVVAQWIADGVPPVDTAHIAVDRTASYETSRRFRRERTVEQLGVLFGDAAWPSWKPSTARNIRRSVLHDRLAAQGAHFGQSAGWEYPEWFAGPGEHPRSEPDFSRPAAHDLIAREHHAVRDAAGVLDMTLMAKFIVQGPDAGAVLGRLSANDVTAGLGRIVYTQWLNEAGGIIADLTVTWLEPEKFLVIASDVIHRRIEPLIRRATRPGEFVTVTDVTSGTTLLSVQGPASRELISRLTDSDLSTASFPYLSARPVQVGYAPALAVRVTYVGELGWELHVPAEYGAGVYDDLMAAGADLGVRPVGLAAMTSLRLEKGYRDFGVDIDNTDSPLAAGLGFAVAWDKAGGFTGRDALLRERAAGVPVNRVVGVVLDDPGVDLFGNEPVLREGAWAGYVRAAAFGHTVGAAVGLAQVGCPDGVTAGWLQAGGFTVRAGDGREVAARLQLAPFYDPQRARILA
jgi:heterotetrameric sarcosine oxidase gamma subunit